MNIYPLIYVLAALILIALVVLAFNSKRYTRDVVIVNNFISEVLAYLVVAEAVACTVQLFLM